MALAQLRDYVEILLTMLPDLECTFDLFKLRSCHLSDLKLATGKWCVDRPGQTFQWRAAGQVDAVH